jgi:soluble lytic murein transglycosylase-like protein
MKIKLAALLALTYSATAAGASCWDEAAQRYAINPYLLYAIAKTESGMNPAAIGHNKNGSRDIGLMQINSHWLPVLERNGIDERALMDPCTNIHVGAWILAQNMRRHGNSWTAVGAYNASAPEAGLRYARRVYRNLPVGLPGAISP